MSMEERLATKIQNVLHSHTVRSDTISETIEFLGSLLGGIISIYAPLMSLDKAMENIRDSVEYGMDTGIPE